MADEFTENFKEKFIGEKITLYDFKATLDEFDNKGVNVEVFTSLSIACYYNNFTNDMTKDFLILKDDKDNSRPTVTIPLEKVLFIVEGTGVFFDHYLVQLCDSHSVFIHRA